MTSPFQAELQGLRVAAGFLTRVPVGDVTDGGTKTVRLDRAVRWFPIIGLLIGAVEGLVYAAMSQLSTPLVSAVLAVSVSALITGAFHHDGLADTADAFGGGWTAERRMEILKDSRLGTYGTTALVLALLLETATVSALTPSKAILVLVAAHTLSRALAVAAMLIAPVAGDGLGASYMTELRWPAPTIAVLVALAATAALIGSTALLAIPMAIAAMSATLWLAFRKIGGVTGDVLGAIQQVSALAVLVAATII